MFSLLFQGAEPETDNKGEVIAEPAALITVSLEGTVWPLATIALFVFQQEGSVVYINGVNLGRQARRCQYVVDGMPLATVAIGAANTIAAFCLGSDVGQSVLIEMKQRRTVSIIVEISCDGNKGLMAKRVDVTAQRVAHLHAVRSCTPLSTITARGMDNV